MEEREILKGLKEIKEDLTTSLYYDASIKLERMIGKLEEELIEVL